MNTDNIEETQILIADDDPLVCHIIQLQLERAGYRDLRTANDGQEAIAEATSNPPDLILLDITLPDMDGLRVLSIIKSADPNIRVIMLTGQRNADYVSRAIADGAEGYLVKRSSDLTTLAETVALIMEGDTVIVDQDLLQQAAKKAASQLEGATQDNEEEALTKQLTTQELEVLKLIAGGLTNSEIGDSLHISYNTVKTHVRNIYQKLKVSDRTQAAIVALRRGITEED